MTLQLTWETNQQAYNYDFMGNALVTIGRKKGCDIVLKDRTVSREHAQVALKHDMFELHNLSQTNAIYVYTKQKLEIGETAPINIGDNLQLGLKHLFIKTRHPGQDTMMLTTSEGNFTLSDRKVTLIGRQADCDVVLNNRTVSRIHAEIFQAKGQFYIRNLSEVTPIYLFSRQRLGRGQTVWLKHGDTFKVGPTNIQTQSLQTMMSEQIADMAHLYKVHCPGCARKIKASQKDCPWCGISLAAGTTAA